MYPHQFYLLISANYEGGFVDSKSVSLDLYLERKLAVFIPAILTA